MQRLLIVINYNYCVFVIEYNTCEQDLHIMEVLLENNYSTIELVEKSQMVVQITTFLLIFCNVA